MARNQPCRHCGDNGWVTQVGPRGPVARRCKCREARSSDSKYGDLGLPPRLLDKSFNNFRAGRFATEKKRHQTLTTAMGRAKRFADEFPGGPNNGLLFHGGTPIEQTHLAVATLKCFADRGFECVYWDYSQLMIALRGRSDSDDSAAAAGREAARRVARADVLLVDSLGEHRRTEWVRDTIGGIVKHRYFGEKCLLVTTGLPLETPSLREPEGFASMRAYRPLEALPDRIGQDTVDRLLDHCELVCIAVPEPRRVGPEASDRLR